MIQYFISSKNPSSHFIEVEMHISDLSNTKLELKIPAWRPARYELQNYAQNIQNLSYLDSNQVKVPASKIDRNTWEINLNSQTNLKLYYKFYANKLDAGGCFVSEDQFYLNPINCLLYVQEKVHEIHELNLKLNPNWQLACSLKQTQNLNSSYSFNLSATSYHELADSPLIASLNIQKYTFKVENLSVCLWFQGEIKPEFNLLENSFKAFIEAQLKIFQTFPIQEYHFLFQILPERFYHGVEHLNSTVIALGPNYNLSKENYTELLEISSHEFFHLWNIKTIRPKELKPYNYSKEVYFKTGYVAEGFTTYYGDLTLLRAGILNFDKFSENLSQTLNRHLQSFGYLNESISESSFDLWVDGYIKGIPNDKVSIYTEGSLIAWILDIWIRDFSQNKHSLDNVMQSFYNQFGANTQGYTEHNLFNIIEEYTTHDIKNKFINLVQNCSCLEARLEEILNYLGCCLELNQNSKVYESKYGFKLDKTKNAVQISQIAPNSPITEILSLDDKIIAVNNCELNSGNADNLFKYFKDDSISLSIFRNQKLLTLNLPQNLSQNTYFKTYKIKKMAELTAAQNTNFTSWSNN